MPFFVLVAFALAGLILAEEIDRQSKGRSVSEEISAVGSDVKAFIEKQEGFSSVAYADGQQTAIGFGHDITGKETTLDPVSLETMDIKTATDAVEQSVIVPLTVNQHTALISLVYNIGTGAFTKSVLLQKLNASDYNGAANEMLRWNKSRNKQGVKVINPVLVKRRADERALFLT